MKIAIKKQRIGGNQATIRHIAPGFRAKGHALRSGKCTLIFGVIGKQAVVIKRLTDREPFWQHRFRDEIDWYASFERHPPPVAVPKLLAADRRNFVMLMTRASGIPLARERYVSAPLDSDRSAALLAALKTLHRWKPGCRPTAIAAIRADYVTRLDRYAKSGALSLDSGQLSQILASLQSTAWTPEFNHGDLLLSNCLWHPRKLTLIDWEFAGYYLPGYDLAFLSLLLAADPDTRAQITERIASQSREQRRAFAVNQMLLVARETRIHRALEESETRTFRLEQLGRDLQSAWSGFIGTL